MTSNDLQTILVDLLEALSQQHVCDDDCRAGGCSGDVADDWKDEIDGDGALKECAVSTYAAGGYLTRDAGLVLRTLDGSEFQITIVQTRHGKHDQDDDGDDESLGACTACGRNDCDCDD
jgi:hypothetical protein